jgi:RNA polymerase-binding transcription factor DksA
MSKSRVEKHRQQLIEMADRMRLDVSRLIGDLRAPSGGQAGGENSNTPLHLADRGSEEFLYDINATVLENETWLAAAVAEALNRIESGQFGTCERCGNRIPEERLDALPYTRHCVGCAEESSDAPAVNLNAGRPAGPEDTLAPEGEMGERHDAGPRHDAGAELPGRLPRGDSHAAGTAGGGTAIGGLAGSNIGRGDPEIAELEQATGSGRFDSDEERHETPPRVGPGIGSDGGRPSGKRGT